MDLSVNKPAKSFLNRKFEEWYRQQITEQLLGVEDIQEVELQPIDLNLGPLKELGAKWMVEMVEYISENPEFIINSFIKAGILAALYCKYVDENNVAEDEDVKEEYDDDEEEESDEEEEPDDEES